MIGKDTMTIIASLIDKQTINQIDFSNPIAIKKEMVQNPEEVIMDYWEC